VPASIKTLIGLKFKLIDPNFAPSCSNLIPGNGNTLKLDTRESATSRSLLMTLSPSITAGALVSPSAVA